MKGRRLMGADTPPRSPHEAARAATMHKQTVTFLMKPRFFFIWFLLKRDNKKRKRFRRDKNVFKCARLKAQTIDRDAYTSRSGGGKRRRRTARIAGQCVAMRHGRREDEIGERRARREERGEPERETSG